MRYMGVAFLIGSELIRAEVENLRGSGMRPAAVIAKATRVLDHWIERYAPDVIAIEQPFFAQSRQSPRLRRLMQAITTLARKKQLTVRLCTPTTVRRHLCPQGRPTRLAVARVIATDRFPWLRPYYEKEAQKSWWRKHYWTSLFDAVAVGLACQGPPASRRIERQAA